MERAGRKVRDIQFYSAKNEGQVCVHTSFARAYAKHLEELDEVKSYEAGYALDQERFKNVSPVGIRKDYFTGGWETDFLIHYQDGRCAVRELVASPEKLHQAATVERLEFSRRYWTVFGITDWKVVLKVENADVDNGCA